VEFGFSSYISDQSFEVTRISTSSHPRFFLHPFIPRRAAMESTSHKYPGVNLPLRQLAQCGTPGTEFYRLGSFEGAADSMSELLTLITFPTQQMTTSLVNELFPTTWPIRPSYRSVAPSVFVPSNLDQADPTWQLQARHQGSARIGCWRAAPTCSRSRFAAKTERESWGELARTRRG